MDEWVWWVEAVMLYVVGGALMGGWLFEHYSHVPADQKHLYAYQGGRRPLHESEWWALTIGSPFWPVALGVIAGRKLYRREHQDAVSDV